jgi:hypothetical protein
MKKCLKCNFEKEFSEFSKDKSRKDGYNNNCRECCKIIHKEHLERKKVRIEQDSEYMKKCEEDRIKRNLKKQIVKKSKRESDPSYLEKKLRREDPEYKKNLIREQRQRRKERFELKCIEDPEYCESVKSRIRENRKRWLENNPEKKKKHGDYRKLRYQLDSEYRKKMNKKSQDRRKQKMLSDPEYRKKMNKKTHDRKKRKMLSDPEYKKNLNQKIVLKKKERYYKNPLYRFRRKMTSSVRRAIKRGYNKNSMIYVVLGADWFSVRTHIESQFVNGMSWENFGEWHMDHILPLSLAKTEEELVKLLHYTNIQPLWGMENIKKSNIIPEGVQLPF